jgi:histidinol-phosphatase (PHP family)
MFDYHIHTTHSFDGHSTMPECAQAALGKGVTEICFTDHHELDYPCDVDMKPDIDFARYFRELAAVREQTPGLTIKAGVETGLIPASLEKIAAALRDLPFDFIIASQHVAQGKDPWFGDYFDDRTLREGQRIYLEEILYDIQRFERFNVVAHIGYVDKYLYKYDNLGEDPRPFTWRDFPDLIDAILRNVIGRGKGIEVNTSNYPVHGWPTPHPSIIRRYAELGGEIVTTGSDAHRAADIGYMIPEARGLLRECGLKYVCTFTRMEPEFHKL